MKNKIILIMLILILIMQGINPIKTNAVDKNTIFNSDITFSWEFVENDDIMNYGLCTPSNADDYKEIPLIVWLHGLEQQGGDGNEISTAYDGFPKAILSENKLEGFCAYVVCPHIPVYSQTGKIWSENEIEELLNKVFQRYNIDKKNVIIMGHSLGANNAIYLAKRMPNYFSKAVICSGGYQEYPTIPIRFYVGTDEVDYYKNSANKFENYYGENVVCWLPGIAHQTPIPAYNKDDGKFLGIANNNCSDMIEWMFEDVELIPTIPEVKLELSENEITIPCQQIKQLKVTSNVSLDNKTIRWNSSNNAVATVNKNGLVTAIGEGIATITVTVGDKTTTEDGREPYETCKVIVSGQLGDVDKDKKITAYDAYKGLENSVDIQAGININEKDVLVLDVDKDGKISAQDAYKILEYSVGLINKF